MYERVNVHVCVCVCLEGVNNVHVTETTPCSHEPVCTAASLANNPHWDPDEGANEVKSDVQNTGGKSPNIHESASQTN